MENHEHTQPEGEQTYGQQISHEEIQQAKRYRQQWHEMRTAYRERVVQYPRLTRVKRHRWRVLGRHGRLISRFLTRRMIFAVVPWFGKIFTIVLPVIVQSLLVMSPLLVWFVAFRREWLGLYGGLSFFVSLGVAILLAGAIGLGWWSAEKEEIRENKNPGDYPQDLNDLSKK